MQSGHSINHYTFGYTVVKVTPKGQVVVTRTSDGHEMRFDNNGRHMGPGASSNYPSRLVTDLATAHEDIRVTTAKHIAARAIEAVRVDVGRYNSKESLAEQVEKLAAALEIARNAVEAI